MQNSKFINNHPCGIQHMYVIVSTLLTLQEFISDRIALNFVVLNWFVLLCGSVVTVLGILAAMLGCVKHPV